MTNRPLVVLFENVDDMATCEDLLKKRTKAPILRLGRQIPDHADPSEVVCIANVPEFRAWMRASLRPPLPSTFLLALRAEFEIYRQILTALGSMNVRFSHLLSSGQDQIVVLDREQRMVGFFGHWPKESPRQVENMLGKRKRDIFGPELAALHEDAASRALNGENASYEWSVTDVPRPVHLFTAASPLRNDDGVIVGVLLVTRNITLLKQAMLETERTLQATTSQLLEVESGVRRIAASLQRQSRGETDHQATRSKESRPFLSQREHQVLDLLCKGERSRSIAQALGISIETVRRHIKAMFRKTGVHSQVALVKFFSDTGELPKQPRTSLRDNADSS
jgi:DNA-binding CsgD family transcriptional regulator/PAS domain-containing protein